MASLGGQFVEYEVPDVERLFVRWRLDHRLLDGPGLIPRAVVDRRLKFDAAVYYSARVTRKAAMVA